MSLRDRLDHTRLHPLMLDKESWLHSGKRQPADIVLVGDSRAAMWVDFPDVGLKFRNFGVSGLTTGQILARYAIEIKPLKPKAIVVVAGVNDLNMPASSADHRRDIEKEAENNIARLVTLAREDDTTVILTTVFGVGELPLRRKLDWPTDFEDNVARLNQFIRSLSGPNIHVFDARALLQNGQHVDAEVLADFLHLNREGYKRLNQELEPMLRVAMSKLVDK